MIYHAADFVFEPAPQLARARRVLIKPSAAYPLPYPVTTSRETLAAIIRGIRRVSDADILLLESPEGDEPARAIYRILGYDFPRLLTLDVRDCVLVEVENPLSKAYALPNVWVPNVLLSCDYLITVAPFKVMASQGWLSLSNLLGLLPASKYGDGHSRFRTILERWTLPQVVADLYFILPFDLGIIDARMKFFCDADPTKGEIEEYGKIFVGEPFEVDSEASRETGVPMPYLSLISAAKADLEGRISE